MDSNPAITIADIKVEINGFVGLQGYGNYPAAVTISLRPVDAPTDLETSDVVTNDGDFTVFTSIELGTYDAAVKAERYLKAIARGIAISGGLEDVTFDPELPDIPAGEMRGGDCNGDNAVSLEDFSILSYYYNERTDVVDINGDGQVDLLDFVILGSNFGFVGVEMCDDDDSTGKMLSSYITGDGRGVDGSGVVATLRFRLMGSSPGAIFIYEPIVADERGKINTLPRKEFALQIPPQRTSLLMNYPNPLNPETWIPYELAAASDVQIEIYSLTGQLIRILDLGYRQPGFYTTKEDAAHWDGRNEAGEEVASGVYFYTIRAGDFSATRRVAVRR
jgi:hypothetical protein